MNANAILKLTFLLTIPIYAVVAWFVLQQPGQDAPPDQMLGILFPVLAGIYLFQVIVIEPIISRTVTRSRGGYTKEVLVIKLAFFESGAVFGFVLSILSRDLNFVLGFGMVAGLLIALRAPLPQHRA